MPKSRPPYFPPNQAYWSRPKSGGRRTVPSIPAPIPIPPIPPIPPVPPVDPLSIFDDEMDGLSINPLWSTFRPELLSLASLGGGQYRFGAQDGGAANSLWFNQFTGLLQGPTITGDCIMLSRMIVRNYAGNAPTPLSQFRIGGISCHDPNFAVQNYCQVALGVLVPDFGASYRMELKNTSNDLSIYPTIPWPEDVYTELALQRLGQIVTFAGRTDPDADFTVGRIVDRDVDGPPFPDDLFWGIIDYSNVAFTDVSCTIDYVRFQTPGFNGGLILPTS